MDTVDATTELIDRIIGDYKGEIEGGNEYIGHLNTKWSVIYKFNSIFYSLLTIQSCLLLLGVKMLEVRVITAYIHCFCTGFVHIAMVVTTGVFRYSSMGRLCATSAVETSSRTTFAEDGQFLESVFIAQTVLFIAFCCTSCCAGVSQIASPTTHESYKESHNCGPLNLNTNKLKANYENCEC